MACRPVTPPAPALFSTTNCCPSLFVKCSEKMRAITSVLPPAANGTMTTTGFDGHLSCANRAPAIKPSVTAAGASLAKIRNRIFPLPSSSNDAWRRSPFMSTLLSPSARGGGLGTRSLGRRFVFMIRNFRYLRPAVDKLSFEAGGDCWPPRPPAKAVHPTGSGTDSKTRHLVTCLQNSPRRCQQKRPLDLFGRRLDGAGLRHGMRIHHVRAIKPVVAVTVRGFTGLPRLGHLRMVRGRSTPVRGRDGEQCFDSP